MKSFLDKFILGFPVLYLKQYPYAWIVVVVLWSWPPVLAGFFLAVVALGIACLRWRSAAWISDQRRQHAPTGETFLVQRVPVPWSRALRNLLILLALAALVSWFAGGLVGLTVLQFFVMIVGFVIFYMDTRFFGAETIYIVTETGVAIYFVPGHLDYRLFISFNEIRRVRRLDAITTIPDSWTVCSRLRDVKSGLLLEPRNPDGFSRRLQEILLTPTNTDEFLKLFPSTLLDEI